ncbi:solute carrier family 46 member 3-like isoform X1 [Haliotis rufescens]|uniref:solute carrier family 46 member 3-like isoform X1 n=1 Tax=Haliotis rufescens TaxID=6454 RepID=UPI00201F2FB5|nr:solute carrier family 46 member 3-like isoform X1 [Haliotis rufescens]
MSVYDKQTRGRGTETFPLLPKPGGQSLNIRNLVIGNVVVCLYFIATNFHNPTMDQYLYRRMTEKVFGNETHHVSVNQTCYVNKSDKHYLLQEKAQQMTSRKQMYFTVARGIFVVLNIVFVGAYSDFIGRKVMFVVAMTGCIVRYCTLTAIIYWELDFNYYFIGEIISGITGYDYSFLLASYAYTADNTPPKKTRTIAIAVLETTLSLANAASQTASGFFIQRTGFLYPSFTSVILMLLAVVFVLLCVTETLPRSEVQQKECFGPRKGIKRIVGFYLFDDTKQTRLLFILALVTYLFFILPSSGVSNTGTLYVLNKPFCWTPETIGYYTMAGTALKQVFGVPIIKFLQHCISDEIIGIASSFVMVAAYTLRGLAYTDWMMYGVAGLEAFTFAISPTVRAIMSRMSPKDRQGSLFTCLMLIQRVLTWSYLVTGSLFTCMMLVQRVLTWSYLVTGSLFTCLMLVQIVLTWSYLVRGSLFTCLMLVQRVLTWSYLVTGSLFTCLMLVRRVLTWSCLVTGSPFTCLMLIRRVLTWSCLVTGSLFTCLMLIQRVLTCSCLVTGSLFTCLMLVRRVLHGHVL